MRRLALAVLLGLAFAPFPGAASPPLEPELLFDLWAVYQTTGDRPYYTNQLDPGGHLVAWAGENERILVLEVSSGLLREVPYPEHARGPLHWSPDGAWITFTFGSSLHFGSDPDPDVWVVHAGDGTSANCTAGNACDAEADPWIDLLPSWRSADSIAFVRLMLDNLDGPAEVRTVSVTACGDLDFPADTDASQSLRFLPEAFPAEFFIEEPLVWSPNGERVALLSQGGSYAGIWILDTVATGTDQFIHTSAFAEGFPSTCDPARVRLTSPAWADGGSRLLVMASDSDSGLTNLLLIEACTGVLTPVFSHADYADEQPPSSPCDNGRTGAFVGPIQAVVLPGGTSFLTLHREAGESHEEVSTIAIRHYSIIEGQAIPQDTATFTEPPQEVLWWSGRRKINGMGDNGVALLLNRYVVRFNLNEL